MNEFETFLVKRYYIYLQRILLLHIQKTRYLLMLSPPIPFMIHVRAAELVKKLFMSFRQNVLQNCVILSDDASVQDTQAEHGTRISSHPLKTSDNILLGRTMSWDKRNPNQISPLNMAKL